MVGLVVVMLAAGGLLWAEDSEWQRSCRFAVQVDGSDTTSGAIYERRGTPDMLGKLADNSWFLLQPAQRRVLELKPGQVAVAQDAHTATLSGALPNDGGTVRLTPAALSFDVTGRWVKVLPTPPLIGEVTAEDFLDLCPDYQEAEVSYEPDTKMVSRLASADGSRSVEVFFGSWCPHCQQILPKLMKSLRLANNSKLQVKWIGLPRSFASEPHVKAREVRGVPTIIVLEEGRELGRFNGTEKVPVEASLANLVQSG
jgi:thiol-disulfide isomerase/thioredoxin